MGVDETTRVERVAVTTPEFEAPEGGNSAWVLPEDGVVVDPGPPGDVPWEHLTEGLADAGLAVEDVEYVVLTHWHVDHVGLAPRLADAADATVSMHERDAPLVGDYAVEREHRVERDAATLARWGVPDEHVESVRGADSRTPLPDEFPVNALQAGDRVGSLSVLPTPGHTAGHAAFVVDGGAEGDAVDGDDAGRAMVGDAALRTITPNVGGGDTRQDAPLAAYRETLDALEAGADRALPGHGTAFDLDERVAEVRAHHRERAGNVRDALETLDEAAADGAGSDGTTADEGATPWAVAEACFGDMVGYHVKFGAGEAFAHLRDLEALDLAERVGEDPLRYAPAIDGGDAGPESDVAARLDDAWHVDGT